MMIMIMVLGLSHLRWDQLRPMMERENALTTHSSLKES